MTLSSNGPSLQELKTLVRNAYPPEAKAGIWYTRCGRQIDEDGWLDCCQPKGHEGDCDAP